MAKPRIDPKTARQTLRDCGAALGTDFHALRSAVVEELAEAARRFHYRPSPHRNGSTARCFHAYLVRVAERD